MSAMKRTIALLALCLATGPVAGQQVEKKVGIVAEEIASQMQAFSYKEGPKSYLLFRSTALALAGEGDGVVEFQDGRSNVEISVRKMPQPWTLGPYATYVLWAVSIDGRASNLGSIELTGDRGKLQTSTALAQFALIVSAEPHFAVSAPSRAVVLQNLADSVRGEAALISGLSRRMDYSRLTPQVVDPKARLPSDLIQARYAVRIAELAEAEEYAHDRYAKARDLLAAAETAQASKKYRERDTAPMIAREAVQAAVRINKALPADGAVSIGIDFGRFLMIPGEDCYGDPVNVAYKLGEDLARPGEILVTASVRARLDAGAGALREQQVSVAGLELLAYSVVYA